MFVIDTFVHGKPEPDSVTPRSSEDQGVSASGDGYDPLLIERLKADHRALKAIFCDIGAANKAGALTQVQQHLARFRATLADHLRKEIGLFRYLEDLLAGDAAKLELMHGFRREMDKMGPVAVGLLAKYEGIAARPRLALSLAGDLALIGVALAGRIQREEDVLYALYVSPKG